MAEETIQDLAFKLKWLGEQLGLKLIRKVGREAATIISDEVSRRAPVDKGILKTDIKLKTKKESPTSIHITIGAGKKAWYARLIEFGVRPHTVTLRSKKVLANVATGEVFGVGAKHPGFAPEPFLGPSVDDKGDEAGARFDDRLWDVVEQAFRKTF